MTEQERLWLQEAVDESVVYQRTLWEEAVEEALREVGKAEVEVIYPDKTPFRDSVREMHESYRGTTVYSLLTEIADVK